MGIVNTILFDRDGTLIVDKHYLATPSEVELLPTAREAICLALQRKYFLGIVSNQSGVGRGYFTEQEMEACTKEACRLLCGDYGTIMVAEHCIHAPEEHCICRKPAIGMWTHIAQQYMRVAESTVMVGDKKEDMLFACSAGFPYAFLVYTGKGKDVLQEFGIEHAENAMVLNTYFSLHVDGYVPCNTVIYGVHSCLDAVLMLERVS